MATPDSCLDPTDSSIVKLEIEEPSLHSEDDANVRLYSDRKIDYVLVYERCPEDEDKDDESKERAKELETMRNKFEESLRNVGLILEYPDEIPDVRQLVSS